MRARAKDKCLIFALIAKLHHAELAKYLNLPSGFGLGLS